MTSKPQKQRIGLEVMERQLDRIQSYYPRIDAKVSALFAISSGQIAVAALNLSADDLTKWWVAVPAAVFLLTIAWTILNLYRCAYPHLKGGTESLVYFNEIAKLTESTYVSRFTSLPQERLEADLAGQIWRNSEIVACKYGYLKHATIAATLSLLPWTILLLATSLSHWRTPIVS